MFKAIFASFILIKQNYLTGACPQPKIHTYQDKTFPIQADD